MKYTAKEILKIYFELKSLSPNIPDWNESYFGDNQTRYYRYRQLIILFTEFELGSLQYFELGEFIKSRPIEEYKPLKSRFVNFLSAYLGLSVDYFNGDDINYDLLIYLFKRFIKYYSLIYDAITFNSDIIEVSGLRKFPYYKIASVNYEISKLVKIIEEELSLFISPDSKKAKVSYLIKKYGFPDVDITEIDLDNI